MAISLALALAMRVFIVAEMRNRAEVNARIVMMYNSAMIWFNPDCPGHRPGPGRRAAP